MQSVSIHGHTAVDCFNVTMLHKQVKLALDKGYVYVQGAPIGVFNGSYGFALGDNRLLELTHYVLQIMKASRYKPDMIKDNYNIVQALKTGGKKKKKV
jgi:hypothetical protein